MKPEAPHASLVIPSLNRGRLLLETVESVLAGADVPAEIIIIDQSGTANAGLASLASPRCDVRYIHSAAVGTSRARNAGVRLAQPPPHRLHRRRCPGCTRLVRSHRTGRRARRPAGRHHGAGHAGAARIVRRLRPVHHHG
jgi:hypothetical protein